MYNVGLSTIETMDELDYCINKLNSIGRPKSNVDINCILLVSVDSESFLINNQVYERIDECQNLINVTRERLKECRQQYTTDSQKNLLDRLVIMFDELSERYSL